MMKKKVLGFILTIAILILGISSITFADSNFEFTIKNTGRTYNVDGNSVNRKETTSGWVVNPYTLRFTDTTSFNNSWGVAFVPMIRSGSGYSQHGDPLWTKTTGRRYGTYGQYSGTGTRFLGARIDDILSGTAVISGKWNADT